MPLRLYRNAHAETLTSPTVNAEGISTDRAAWNAPQAPFRIYGNTFYVGPHGLSSILVDTGRGLVLLDGDLPESAPQIEAHIRALGFRVRDVKWILSSHTHIDHAGGIATLQRASGAQVLASPAGTRVLEASGSDFWRRVQRGKSGAGLTPLIDRGACRRHAAAAARALNARLRQELAAAK